LAACVLATFGTATLAHANVLDTVLTPPHAAGTGLNLPIRHISTMSLDSIRVGTPWTRPASTMMVSNCDDAGPGSLRQALLDAVDGDSIDLTGLACSTITLTTGMLDTTAAVTIQGPGEAALTIDGGGTSRVLHSSGTSLSIYDVTLANGYSVDFGGC